MIDLGSNSVRMLVVEASASGQWRVVDEARSLLRLGDCLLEHGLLAPLLPTTSWVMSSWVQRARQAGVTDIVAVATAALRAAPDGVAFTRALEQASGVRIRIVDAEEEARLGFLGATRSLDVATGHLVDLGGASTEISSFQDQRRLRSISMPLGSVTLGRIFLSSDPPTASQLTAADREARRQVEAALPDPVLGLPLVAIGGSFRSIAKMHLRASGYPMPTLHNYRLTPGAVDALYLKLTSLPFRLRRQVPGLAAHRAETVLGALTLAQAVLGWLKPSVIVISGVGLREGLLFAHLGQRRDAVEPDRFQESVDNLLFQLASEPDPALLRLSAELAAALSPLLPDGSLPLLTASAKLRGLGQRVNFYDRHRHTFYLVLHGRLFGVSHGQQVVLAAAAGYEGPHRLSRLLRPYAQMFEAEEASLAGRLGLIVAFSEALVRQAPAQRLTIDAEITTKQISLLIGGAELGPEVPYDDLGRLSAQFAKVFGRRLKLSFRPA